MKATTIPYSFSKPGILVGIKAEAQLIRKIFPYATIAISGATKEGARRESIRLATCGSNCLLSFGLAAGLNPALSTGSIIIPDKVVTRDGNSWTCHPALRHVLGHNPREVYSGSLLHSDDIIFNASHKIALFSSSQCQALDMESGFLAQAAHDSGLPFAVLRVICDPATRSLPPVIQFVLSPEGGLKIGTLFTSLLRNPSQIQGLTRLGYDAFQARRSMLAFLRKQESKIVSNAMDH
ncbi:MAG: hypothetical protein J6P00_04135 [Acetobacter sp.]|nr:hypothetical protein [Acetobacter sp.]